MIAKENKSATVGRRGRPEPVASLCTPKAADLNPRKDWFVTLADQIDGTSEEHFSSAKPAFLINLWSTVYLAVNKDPRMRSRVVMNEYIGFW